MKAAALVPSGFFALRTPLAPRGVLFDLSEALLAPSARDDETLAAHVSQDRARVLGQLRVLLERPEIREAIFLASRSLYGALDVWLRSPDAPRAADAPLALFRYVTRLTSRSQPFGLFSGCSVGRLDACTELVLGARAEYRRHTQLDAEDLAALCGALEKDPALRAALRYWPSTGLYSAGGRLRYFEENGERSGQVRGYRLVALDPSPYVDDLLDLAARGATLEELVLGLLERTPGLDRADVERFVEGAIESQVVTSEIAPHLVTEDALGDVEETLRRRVPRAAAAAVIAQVRRELIDLDAAGLGQPAGRYLDIGARIDDLYGAPRAAARGFHVDLYKPARATLGNTAVSEIERSVALLARMTERSEDESLRRFRERFLERYGSGLGGSFEGRRMWPLAEVLDEEAGIGFPHPTGGFREPSTLLESLEPPGGLASEVPFGPREERLLRGLSEVLSAGKTEWQLSDADLTALSAVDPAPLPDAFAVLATVAARSSEALDRGDFRLLVHAVSGPSGANLLGRFCGGDPELRRHVAAHLRAEEARRPDAVFAEVVHLPEARVGNVLCRPPLRSYEIPFLGSTVTPHDRQISISDLEITLFQGRLILWSERLGREVIPRLSTAHAYPREALGIYRFLCALQGQSEGYARPQWSWGPLETAPFLPRVSRGRMILCLARWNLIEEELTSFAKLKGPILFRAVQALRNARGLPRWVALVDGDNVVPLDLLNIVALESWCSAFQARKRVTLQEVFPDQDELVVSGPEGRFVHELVVPFVRAREPEAASRGHLRVARGTATTRLFPPGSEWLFAKLYTGTEGADIVLSDVVAKVVEAARQAGAIKGWFFLRYGDPHWHVRARFRGPIRELMMIVPALIHDAATPLLHNGLIWRVQYDTYEREVERYGGARGIELAEEIFEADSDAAISIVQSLADDADPEARWCAALLGCHLLLVDLGLNCAARVGVLREARAALAAELGVDREFERVLGRKFRVQRPRLDALLSTTNARVPNPSPSITAFARRGERLRSVTQTLRELESSRELSVSIATLAQSLMHMHCNRLLSADHRTQELVLYDWLLRLTRSEEVRS